MRSDMRKGFAGAKVVAGLTVAACIGLAGLAGGGGAAVIAAGVWGWLLS